MINKAEEFNLAPRSLNLMSYNMHIAHNKQISANTLFSGNQYAHVFAEGISSTAFTRLMKLDLKSNSFK